MLKLYYSLTKPGMIRGNAIIAAAGFLFASRGHIDFIVLITMLVGISLVIASGCVFNNYLDRDIDAKMPRTKNRAFPMHKVSAQNAIVFASILGIIGFFILAFYTNILVVCLALIGALVYVGLYTPQKHRSEYAALVGSISGAIPIVVGYCAVTGTFDLAACILFLILVAWQMPHFYSISIYRHDEYKDASVPVFSVKKGIRRTNFHILFYIVAFIVSTLLLTVYGYAGYIYATIMSIIGLLWLGLSLQSFSSSDQRNHARKLFFFSLVVIMVFSVTIALSPLLKF